jgi:membrane dipeptidase
LKIFDIGQSLFPIPKDERRPADRNLELAITRIRSNRMKDLDRIHFLKLAAAGLAAPVPDKSLRFRQTVMGKEILLMKEALRIHRAAIVVDTHNDLLYRSRSKGLSVLKDLDLKSNQPDFHTDIPRLRKGGVGAQFWVADGGIVKPGNGKSSLGICLEDIDLIHKMVEKYPDEFEMAYTADDIMRIRKKGKIASLIGVESGAAIENSLAVLGSFYRLGVRYMTLTWGAAIDWADSATDKALHAGLTEFGERVVLEMNRLGMLVDISHVSADAMRRVLRISRAPVIASHSSAYALASTNRNVPDDVLRSMQKNGGVVMVNFFPGFLTQEGAKLDQPYWDYLHKLESDPNLTEAEINKLTDKWDEEHPVPKCSVEKVVDHIEYIAKTAGPDHVGLGSDFDGIPFGPSNLEDVSYFPYITQVLLDRGHGEKEIRNILGGNFLRVFRAAQQAAGMGVTGN